MKVLGISIALALGLAAGFAAGGRQLAGKEPEQGAAAKGSGVGATQPPAAGPQVEDPKAVYQVSVEDAPVRGPADALVTVVEFVDLECPFCKRAAPEVRRLEEDYRGKVRLAFRHFPLSMHRSAAPAAMVAEAARAHGGDPAFWKVVDSLLAAEPLDAVAIDRAGREVGLEPARVQAEHPERFVERLRRDQNLGIPLGVSGTPTFFVNGRKLVGAQPYAALRALVDEELAKAQALVHSGVAPRDVYARAIARGATAPVMVAGPAPAPRQDVKVALRPDDPARGGANARVTVVEFSDFQCPFCARAVPAVKELERAYGKDVRVVWKHLPLPFHANALAAALAAEAARAQGKFWEMHDRLFADQQALSDDACSRHAKELGLDLARFGADRKGGAARRRVEEDAAAAAAAGVAGTPTFVVNGELVVGSGGLRDAVARQLERARLAAR